MQAIAVIFLVLGVCNQRAPGTGSLNVLVVDSLTAAPVTSAIVSISRLGERTGALCAVEVGKKAVNQQGIAHFDDLSPGEYLILAIIEIGDITLRRVGAAACTAISADSVSTILIPINRLSARTLPFEDWSPNYRMPFMVPEASMEEPMPIYNPEEWRRMLQDTSKGPHRR